MLRKLHENGDFHSRWVLEVKSILDNRGMSNLWDEDTVLHLNWVKLSLDRRLHDIDYQNWHDEVNANRLCFNYRIFKQEVILENYLIKLEVDDRISLCKFRCGNHNLPVAKCRYSSDQPLEICPLCNLHVQGDEFHYVLVCPFFINERKKYVKRYYYRRPNVITFNQLFSAKSITQLKSLSKFCKIIMNNFR